ncbi:MAG: HepT-like ribonuclease domain-containing protein [Phycisphaerae bacterium]
MLDAARTVRRVVAGVSLETYLSGRTLQLAIERAIEIVGEAARFVSREFREAHPQVPWSSIVAQRLWRP